MRHDHVFPVGIHTQRLIQHVGVTGEGLAPLSVAIGDILVTKSKAEVSSGRLVQV